MQVECQLTRFTPRFIAQNLIGIEIGPDRRDKEKSISLSTT